MSKDAEQADLMEEIAGHVLRARRILFITGAGISAPSGLPTYRGRGGLYTNGEVTEEGIPVEELASIEMFERRPDAIWRQMARRDVLASGATFNEAHRVIAEMESNVHLGEVWVLTQNVDGFHRQAGSENIIEIHGNLRRIHCVGCDWRDEVENYSGFTDFPPTCPACGGILRPSVILFGEMLPLDELERLEEQQALGFDLVFSVGTTSVFPYIAQPVLDAAARGLPTVEVNPEHSEVSRLVDYRLRADAVEALTDLWQACHRRLVHGID